MTTEQAQQAQQAQLTESRPEIRLMAFVNGQPQQVQFIEKLVGKTKVVELNLDGGEAVESFVISTNITTFESIMTILLLNNSIKQWDSQAKVGLHIPYIPHTINGVEVHGVSNNINVLADVINTGKFSKVITFGAPQSFVNLVENSINVNVGLILSQFVGTQEYFDFFGTTSATDLLMFTNDPSVFTAIYGSMPGVQPQFIWNAGHYAKCIPHDGRITDALLVVNSIQDKASILEHINSMKDAMPDTRISLFSTHILITKEELDEVIQNVSKLLITDSCVEIEHEKVICMRVSI